MFLPPGVTISALQYFEPAQTETKIAYRRYESPRETRCGLLYCEGLKSDMQGVKSMTLEVESQLRLRIGCVRFDFQGQGASSGEYEQASLCQWVTNCLDMLDHVCSREPQIIVGSSIGAWVALHAAIQRPQRVKALVLIAPAVDITEIWWRRMSGKERQRALDTQKVPLPGDYLQHDEAFVSLTFCDRAKHLLLLSGPPKSIAVDCPVRIFHGLRDTVAPPSLSRELTEKLRTDDVHITLVKDGDHRLSRPQDLSAIYGAVGEMVDY